MSLIDQHLFGPRGANAGKFSVRDKLMLYQMVIGTVNQHQSSMKYYSVLLSSAEFVWIGIAGCIACLPLPGWVAGWHAGTGVRHRG
jgi:hypothetical protein